MRLKKPAAAPSRRQQLLIVDDHPMMREGLAQLVGSQPDLAICGQAADAPAAIAAITAGAPDLVLADISLPGKNGIELIKDLHSLRPGLPVLVISMHDEGLWAERVLRAGGRGYIMKQEGGKKLLEAIRQVLAGRIYLSEKMSARILEVFSGQGSQRMDSPVAQLSDREFEVFQLIGQGRSTRQIAEQLHLSAKTVDVHRAHIKSKLGLKTAAELVHFAVCWTESPAADERPR